MVASSKAQYLSSMIDGDDRGEVTRKRLKRASGATVYVCFRWHILCTIYYRMNNIRAISIKQKYTTILYYSYSNLLPYRLSFSSSDASVII